MAAAAACESLSVSHLAEASGLLDKAFGASMVHMG
eukprot:COSAG02_NODE_11545_length_1701_cov_10.353933_1_plen_34_part_10